MFDPLKLRTKVALVPCLSRSWRQPRPRQFYDSHDSHVRRVTQKDSFEKIERQDYSWCKKNRKLRKTRNNWVTGKETTMSTWTRLCESIRRLQLLTTTTTKDKMDTYSWNVDARKTWYMCKNWCSGAQFWKEHNSMPFAEVQNGTVRSPLSK